eukprot:CAMPEP_0202414478 /NCGR_PEP_ID=MMETSP1128-20130828/32966_1 /ASSEMBLY_ACC=CAM_ASM_000463 /TAXON_ID=3047 /ORGANISM="Dunaliella tertiolecta, Strain CCMP1320" /LENGTH=53 /DNA_ID=CAMNT_0049020909 /DNA_START=67 /DNA_END=225 /DNA_ORIENTATION=+
MGEEVDEGTGGSADEAVGDNVAVAAEATKKLVLAHAGGDLAYPQRPCRRIALL